MTTTINVQAAGHNLVVIQQDEVRDAKGETSHYVDSYVFIQKMKTGTFYAHQTRDVTVTEVPDDAVELNALIEAEDYEGALAFMEAIAQDEVLFGGGSNIN